MRQNCANSWCKQPFEVTNDDLAFYEKVSPVFNGKKELIPPPKMCPECRMQRRLAFRNERYLHRRICDLAGARIISVFPEDAPFAVYASEAWHSDRWDATDSCMEWNAEKPFLPQFGTLRARTPRIALITVKTENCPYANQVWHSKNVYMSFDMGFCEDTAYSYASYHSQDLVDCAFTRDAELSYELTDSVKCTGCVALQDCSGCHDTFFSFDCNQCDNIAFCWNLRNKSNCIFNEQVTPEDFQRALSDIRSGSLRKSNSNLLYCDWMGTCNDCFGCVGLKHKQHCILNKQYTKEEYEALVPKIIAEMRADGEWGEFFPVTMSPFAYNETVAQEYFPLTKEEVLNRGWKWRDEVDETPKVAKIIPAEQLPDSIDDIPDDILNWAIECEATKRPYKIIRQELEFYRKMRLPVPHLHPDERHKRRMAMRNPRKLWKRPCMKCGREMETTYAPERKEIVYCESCYLAEVYG